MTKLAGQQQALLQLLFTGAALPPGAAVATGLPFHGERGLRAYRANGLALAERSLSACFPVVAQSTTGKQRIEVDTTKGLQQA